MHSDQLELMDPSDRQLCTNHRQEFPMQAQAQAQSPNTLFGHPTGLFTLFFAEMWERFSYYGMRALLVFYMIKGFLGYGDKEAYAVYGAYTALVYATPYIGGMLADRLLGARRAVVLGGLLMAGGHLLMTLENETTFFVALALLIVGNGFFKPNISTIVGSLYPDGSPKRDAGFTIFYMGINLGAAMSPVICGYVGETYGWHYGFGLATAGMLVGLAVFIAPVWLTQMLILGGALATAIAMPFFQDSLLQLGVRIFLGLALAVAGVIAYIALGRGGLPEEAGAPPDAKALTDKLGGVLRKDWAVYVGTAIAVPFLALLVGRNELAGWILTIFGGVAFLFLIVEALKSEKIERERMFVVLILMFFSMLFWAFFEQAGSSVNNFTDRNVDRVFEDKVITAEDVGKTIPIQLGQEQFGRTNGDQLVTMTVVEKAGKAPVDWVVSEDDVGMGISGAVVPASEFQAANPIFILIFGLLFTALWGFLGVRGIEPSTPVKFSLGLLQLGLGFGALWIGAQNADARGMVGLSWLLLGYLLHTTGELCISPVGLSMVTKLSPVRIVSTVMGAWFLATAFSNYLASMIAALTGVSHGGDGGQVIPAPIETVNVYGGVFGTIGVTAIVSALICLALSPLLSRWMHEGEDATSST